MTSDPPGREDADHAEEAEDLDDADFDLPPWSIWYAVRLMWAGAGLSVLVIVVTFLTQDSIKRALADQQRQQNRYSAHSADAAYQSLLTSTMTISVLGAVVWLWMARANGAGKTWARIFATALAATTLVGFGLSFTADGVTTAQIVLSGLNVLIAACVVGLLWHPASSDFYWYKSKRR